MEKLLGIVLSVLSISCVSYSQSDMSDFEHLTTGLKPVKICSLNASGPQITMGASPRGEICLTGPTGWRLFGLKKDGSPAFEDKLDSPDSRIIGGSLKGFFVLDGLNDITTYYSWRGGREAAWKHPEDNTCGTVSASGRIYLASDPFAGITVLDQAGGLAGEVTPALRGGTLKRVTSIAVSHDAGYIAMFDAGAGRLYLLNGYGHQLDGVDAKLGLSSSAICFSRNGRLWTCDSEHNMVRIYSASSTGLMPADSFRIVSPVAMAEGAYGSIYLVAEGGLWLIKYR